MGCCATVGLLAVVVTGARDLSEKAIIGEEDMSRERPAQKRGSKLAVLLGEPHAVRIYFLYILDRSLPETGNLF